jgi:NADP-dependent 3-hydroxy acid dehydrogenase YdfG
MTSPQSDQHVAVVTGASSGIGEATAKTLAEQGFHVVAVARRADRIKALADQIGGTAVVTDVTDDGAVEALARGLNRVDVLVNNAGGARGLEFVADADLEHWRWMWETNVMGTLRVTRALLPKLVDSGDGLIVTITSIAAMETYDGGAGYTAAKHAQGALHRTLRGELLGKPVRLTEIAPGAVETEFSLVRFDGDQQRADAVYAGMTPLVAEDIAEVIGFVVSRPSHVNLDQIVIRPRDQATASRKARPATMQWGNRPLAGDAQRDVGVLPSPAGTPPACGGVGALPSPAGTPPACGGEPANHTTGRVGR